MSVKLPNAIILTKCTFAPRMAPFALDERLPGQFKIYGSNDGSAWNELHHQATALVSNAGATISVDVKPGPAYSHIAFVAASLSRPSGANPDSVNIKQWEIYGQVILSSQIERQEHTFHCVCVCKHYNNGYALRQYYHSYGTALLL